VLGTGKKLDGVVASAVVEAFKRTSARKANADGRLGVAATQRLPLALPVVAGDMAKMLVAHLDSFLAVLAFAVPSPPHFSHRA